MLKFQIPFTDHTWWAVGRRVQLVWCWGTQIVKKWGYIEYSYLTPIYCRGVPCAPKNFWYVSQCLCRLQVVAFKTELLVREMKKVKSPFKVNLGFRCLYLRLTPHPLIHLALFGWSLICFLLCTDVFLFKIAVRTPPNNRIHLLTAKLPIKFGFIERCALLKIK